MTTNPGSRARSALIVANSTYADTTLRRLRAPSRDAEELARVLGSAEIGGFSVDRALDEPAHVLRRRIAAFFADRAIDDLLVLHLSGHGVKDEDGSLYFAAADTDASQLDATALSAEFLNRQMARSRSRSIVLFLDCCFSGAFARDALARGSASVGVKESFGGQGKIVLTSSNSAEYALEGTEIEGEGQPSYFTRAIVEGLETGAADRDGDQLVTVDELYDFVFDAVRRTTPNQTPCKWTFDVRGDIYLARNPAPVVAEASLLPEPLLQALENPLSSVRESAAIELGRYLGNRDRRLAAAARLALERLVGDDSRRVGVAASAALAAFAGAETPAAAHEPQPVVIAEPDPPAAVGAERSVPDVPDIVETRPPSPPAEVVAATPPSTRPAAADVAPIRGPALLLGLLGAVAIVADMAVPWARSSQITFARQPGVRFFWDLAWDNAEIVGVAAAVVVLLLGVRAGAIGPRDGGSALLGFAIVTAASGVETIAWVAHHSLDPPGLSPAGVVLLLAALAFVPAVRACLRGGASPEAPPARPAVAWTWLAGSVVLLAGVFVHVDGTRLSYLSISDWFTAEIFVAAGVIAAVGLRSLAGQPFRRVRAVPLVAAIGLQSSLYFLGVALTWMGASYPAAFSIGDLVGLAGALVVLAGCLVSRRATVETQQPI